MSLRMVCVCFVGLSLYLAPAVSSARTWHISADGSGDVTTIKAGIDSSVAGDTVLVQSGTYYEWGIYIVKSGIVVVSETGEYGSVTIDAQRHWTVLGCAGCDSTTVIQGFTITGGLTTEEQGPPGAGAGMECDGSLRVVNCLFLDNLSYGYGGGVFVTMNAKPRFESCVFIGNRAAQGGAIYSTESSCIITDCTFVGNYSDNAGTVYCLGGSSLIRRCTFYGNSAGDGGSGIACEASVSFRSPRIDCTVIASGSSDRGAIDCDEWSHPVFTCCDVYGNVGGDWNGYIANQNGVNGNFSADPRFCDAPHGNLTLQSCSPCLPGNHPDGYACNGVIGAYDSGCECSDAVKQSTWGSIKAMYK